MSSSNTLRIVIGVDSSDAKRGLAETEAGLDSVADSIKKLQSTRPLDAARDVLNLRSFKDIQREIDLTQAAYNRLERSGKLSATELARAHDITTSSVQRLRAEMGLVSDSGAAVKKTAGELNAAMRMLPAQMTDIVSGLATGQSPFMVMMQQGGQLRDAFGGIGAAAKAVAGSVLGVVNPFTIAAAAAGGLFLAYMKGSDESDAYAKALIMTGGAAGVTAGHLADVAKRIDGVVGTQAKAADVLAQFAGASNIDSGGLEAFATAAIKMERATGASVSETVKQFSALGQAPLQESLKLNDGTNYLTESVYRQIKALQEAGRTEDAAAVAQKAYADALGERAGQIEAHIGTLERGWRGIKDVAAEAWDAMLGIGRAETLGDQIGKAQKHVDDLQQHLAKGGRKGLFGEKIDDGSAEELMAARAELDRLKSKSVAEDLAAKQKADAATLLKGRVVFDEAGKQYLTAVQKLNKEVEQARNTGAAAGASAAEINTRITAIRFQFDLAQYEAAAALKTAAAKAAADADIRQQEQLQAELDQLRALGLVNERDAAKGSLAIELAKLADRRKLAQQAIDIEAKRPVPVGDPAAATQHQARMTSLRAELDGIKALQQQAGQVTARKVDLFDLAEARAAASEYAQVWQQAHTQAQQAADANARVMAQLIVDPLKRARAEAELDAKVIERTAAETEASMRRAVDALRARGQGGMADTLSGQIDAMRTQDQQRASNARMAPDRKLVQDYIGTDTGAQIAAGFDSASQAMSAFTGGFAKLISEQERYNNAKNAQGATAEQVAAIEAKHAMTTVSGYAAMAGAAKGFFSKGSDGYRLMAGAEKAFHAAELAMSIQNAARQLGLISTVTTAKVAGEVVKSSAAMAGQDTETAAVMAGEAERNAAKVPGVFMAYMSALGPWGAAAAGVAVAAVLGGAFSGGGGGGPAPANEGTGTVLGDKGAKSESITKSLDALADVDATTMRYSAEMRTSLKNIEGNISGLASLMVRGGNLSAASAGINTDFQRDAIGKTVGAWADILTLGAMPALGKVVGDLFGSKSSIVGNGIAAGPQSLGKITGSGSMDAQYYADIETKKKFFGVTTSETTGTNYSKADDETKRQLGLVFAGVSDSLHSAAGALGRDSGEVRTALDAYVVNLGRVDLKGLTGTQIGEKLTAVIGAESDKIAKAALPGLDALQHVGEGYYQTAVRVASGVEEAGTRLSRFGVLAVDVGSIGNKQGDAAAEIVRSSLLRAEESMRGGMSGILATLSGSAGDIADTYSKMFDARRSMQLLGLGAQDLTREVINSAGGLDQLTSSLADYEKNFLSSAEQHSAATGRLRDDFARLGQQMPATRDQFRTMVEAASHDTSESGQRLFTGLISLSGAFANVAESVASAGKGIEDEVSRIRGLISGGSESSNLAAVQADFAVKTASARAGNSEAMKELPSISKSLLDMTAKQATNRLDLVREQARVADSLEQTNAAFSAAASPLAAAAASAISAPQQATAGPGSAAVQPAAGTAQAAAAPLPVQPASSPLGSPLDFAPVLRELVGLRGAIESLMDEQAGANTSIAEAVRRTASILDRVTPDGDAIAIRTAR